MKIAQVVCTYPPYRGGIGNAAKTYTELIRDLGHEVSVFTPLYKKEQKKQYGKEVVLIRPLLKSGNGAFLHSLFFRLKKFDYIILHYPFFGTAEVVMLHKLLGKKTGKLIIFYHMDVELPSFFLKFLSIPSKLSFPPLLKSAEKIICSSIDYAENGQIKSFFKKYKNKFIEIPFGVDTQVFKPLKNKTEKKYILFVGSLDDAHYFKGLDNLIIAFSKLKNKNISLKIVGEGNMRRDYENTAKKFCCAERVDFLGSVSGKHLAALYGGAYFFVLPSINNNEAFGIVLIEAMASGTPLIASRLRGVRTVFENGEQGFFAEPNNIEDLKDKMERFIESEPLRDKMAEKALMLARKKYSLKKMREKLKNTIV